MTNDAPVNLFTSIGQHTVRAAHRSDALHILAMSDTSDKAAIGRQLLSQMVKRPLSNNIVLERLGRIPVMIDLFNQDDLRRIIRAAWSQAGFIPPIVEDYTLESLGAAALKHYRATEKVGGQRYVNSASVQSHDFTAGASFANALVDLKEISDRIDSTAQAITGADGSSALKDLVSLQSEMSRGFSRLHEVIVDEIVPGWLRQTEEAGRAAAKSIRLTGIGLVITIFVSVLVAVAQMFADYTGSIESSKQEEAIIFLLKEQLSEEKKIRSEMTRQLNVYQSESRDVIKKLTEQIEKISPPMSASGEDGMQSQR